MIKHFEKNIKGKDFVVGDIHGCFSLLEARLKEIKFDEKTDRLFSVGDLVGSGPESEEFWDWLRKPWFHAVKANHEQMTIDAFREGENNHSAALHYINGGSWFYGLPKVEQECYVLEMEEMPLAIEVETETGLVGIIHAEVPLDDWNLFKSRYEANKDRFDAVAMWSRSRIGGSYVNLNVKGVEKVYVGHTPLTDVKEIGNVVYIDTGACFEDGKLTILQIN